MATRLRPRRGPRTLRTLLASLPALAGAAGLSAQEDPRLLLARELAGRGPAERAVTLQVDAALGHPEAFSIRAEGNRVAIAGGGPGGLLYGAGTWLAAPDSPPAGLQRPDFALRGTVLYLMKEGHYDYRLTPEEFPWFYDRPLLTRFLDHLLDNRFNTIFLWTGHLFPSIMELPAYPDARWVTPEELARNREQFRWFTHECARRNISVLLHFYNIHVSKALAGARGIPVQYEAPNDFVKEYTLYTLKRFIQEFESVGLYVCPGEVLAAKHQPEWIRDVIFRAAKESGRNPVVVIRDWFMDTELFRRVCRGEYDNAWTELKHNVEMVVSPVPDERHREWLGVMKKHIVNLHEAADVKPFRWGSPRFIQEMVREWRRLGVDGAEIYGLASWRWPYTLDRLEPGQRGFWPPGPKLITWERDQIWLTAFGRYLWRADRDPAGEQAWWRQWLAKRFGGEEAGGLLLAWYELTGPILPGLQNLTSIECDNRFPTAVAKEQDADAILTARRWLGEPYVGHYPDTAPHYPARPVDEFFFQRYRARYAVPGLENRITRPVAEHAHRLARGLPTEDAMAPDKVVDLLVEMAEEAVPLAERARAAAQGDPEEAGRFVTDSQALVLVARVWRHKVLAALEKGRLRLTGREEHRQAYQKHLEEALAVYTRLAALTDRTYLNATDIRLVFGWRNGLRQCRLELACFYAAEAWRHRASACLARTKAEEAEEVDRPAYRRACRRSLERALEYQGRLCDLAGGGFLAGLLGEAQAGKAWLEEMLAKDKDG